MSGLGTRFVESGYVVPKPLIKVNRIRIIEHVCNLFPDETKFTFICNSFHLKKTNMKKILKELKPSSNIIEIPKHKKGPVYAVLSAFELIDDNEEVIVNYCDFSTYWDYNDFLNHTRNRKADGAIPSYKGFHPHMLGNDNYAFIRDDKQWLLEIQEKKPFSNNKMNEYASNGTYYFRTGKILKKYFLKIIDKNIHLKGEFYVSMVYNLLINDNLKVSIYEIQHMLQWGTPNDLLEYKVWSNYFTSLVSLDKNEFVDKLCTTVVPLAGLGSRFSKEGFKKPKPLLEISGKPMIIQATNSLPKNNKFKFIVLKEHVKKYNIDKTLQNQYDNSEIIILDSLTEGQAITCNYAIKNIDDNDSILIAASDNGMIFDYNKYLSLINDKSIDAIIFTFKNHISVKNNPKMYGYVKTKDDIALNVSVKNPISNTPELDHAIVGAFYIRKSIYFKKGLKNIINKNKRVNNEFYVDSLLDELIVLNYKVKVFKIDHYICWGTPNDYETFVYWQSFFHKISWHPYSLKKDITVNQQRIVELDNRYRKFKQKYK